VTSSSDVPLRGATGHGARASAGGAIRPAHDRLGDATGSAQFNIHDILRVRTNVRIAPRIPAWFRVDSVEPNFELVGVQGMERPDAGRIKAAIGYPRTCDLGDGEVFYEFHLPFLHYLGVSETWKLRVTGLTDDRTRITSTLPFFAFGPMRARLTDLLSRIAYTLLGIRLARAGYALCHASAVSKGDTAYLFFAYGGTGKTTLTRSLMNTHCDGYMSDDYALVDARGRAYCWPEYTAPHSSERGTAGLRYVLGHYRETSAAPYPVRKDAQVAAIFFLEHGADEVVEIAADEAARRAVLLNMEEVWRLWNSPAAQVVSQYAYFYPELDMGGLMDAYGSCVTSFVRHAPRAYVVRSNQAGFPGARDTIDRLMRDASR